MICSDPLLPSGGGGGGGANGVGGGDDIEVSWSNYQFTFNLVVLAHINPARCIIAAYFQEDGHFNLINLCPSQSPVASFITGRIKLGRSRPVQLSERCPDKDGA